MRISPYRILIFGEGLISLSVLTTRSIPVSMPQEGHGFLQRVSLYVIYTEVAYEILETSLRRECTFVFVCLVYKFFAVYEIRFLHFWRGEAKTTKKKLKRYLPTAILVIATDALKHLQLKSMITSMSPKIFQPLTSVSF